MTRMMVQRYRRQGVVQHVITTDPVAGRYLVVQVKTGEYPRVLPVRGQEEADRMFLTVYKTLVSVGWMRDGEPQIRTIEEMAPDNFRVHWVRTVMVPTVLGSDADA